MRFWFSLPRIFGIRPGISLASDEFARRRSRANNKSIEGSFVYVISSNNLVKIGVTTNPRVRLATLQSASGTQLEFAFIGVTPSNGFRIERAAHKILESHSCSGEWFDVSPELAASAVLGAAASLGQPMRPIDLQTTDAILKVAAMENCNDSPQPFRAIEWMEWLFVTPFIYIFCCLIPIAIIAFISDIPSDGITVAGLIGLPLSMWVAYRRLRPKS